MPKKVYNLEQTPEQIKAGEELKNKQLVTQAGRFVANDTAAGHFGMEGFEDLSLPPIIKYRGLQHGAIIFGEIQKFGEFHQDKIHSALITCHHLQGNTETKLLERTGSRFSLPVSTVLMRSLTGDLLKDNDKPEPSDIIDAIEKMGFGPGTILGMQYLGTGKERKNQNAPHLWDIRAKKLSGEVMAATASEKKSKK